MKPLFQVPVPKLQIYPANIQFWLKHVPFKTSNKHKNRSKVIFQ